MCSIGWIQRAVMLSFHHVKSRHLHWSVYNTTHARCGWSTGPTWLTFWCKIYSDIQLSFTHIYSAMECTQCYYEVTMGPSPCGLMTAEWACTNNQHSSWNFRGNSCRVKEANKLPSTYEWFSLLDPWCTFLHMIDVVNFIYFTLVYVIHLFMEGQHTLININIM